MPEYIVQYITWGKEAEGPYEGSMRAEVHYYIGDPCSAAACRLPGGPGARPLPMPNQDWIGPPPAALFISPGGGGRLGRCRLRRYLKAPACLLLNVHLRTMCQ